MLTTKEKSRLIKYKASRLLWFSSFVRKQYKVIVFVYITSYYIDIHWQLFIIKETNITILKTWLKEVQKYAF